MRVVIDTNVLVSALLNPGRVPDQTIAVVCSREFVLLYDTRIATEYRTVLARPKFASIDPARTQALLAALFARGEEVSVETPWSGAMIDPDDRAFVEVALAGRADAVVTGNTRHFPTHLSFAVWTPGVLLERCTVR